MTLQALIDAAGSGTTLDLTGQTFTDSATVNKPLTLTGGTINAPAGGPGLTITANSVTLDGLHITGAGAAAYNASEKGILVNGSAGAVVSGLTIRNCTVQSFGYGGMYLRYVTGATISGNSILDGVYTGIMLLSADHCTVSGNTVRRIGIFDSQANSGNAYGIALTWQVPGTDSVTSDCTMSGNTVEDVPTWHGLDTHSGQRVTISGNTTRRCKNGVFVTGSVAAPSLDCFVTGNQIESPGGGAGYAVTVVYSTNTTVTGNTLYRWTAGHEVFTTSGFPGEDAVGLVSTLNVTVPRSPAPTGLVF